MTSDGNISKDPETGAFVGVQTVLITGANRGIGLGLAHDFLRRGHHIVATARNVDGARELWELERDYGARCRLVQLDVTSDRDTEHLVSVLGNSTLDVLVNNAGVLLDGDAKFATMSFDLLAKSFAINAIAPWRVTRAVLPHLKRAAQPKVATLSSKMGSITENTSGGHYAYRSSKAAVNALNKSFALDHPKITAVVFHPGWVKTDMGGAAAPLAVDAATSALAGVILGLNPNDTGKFLDYRGQELPW